jgi:hypothetical protein
MSATNKTITEIIDFESNPDKFLDEFESLRKLSDQELDALLEPLRQAETQPQTGSMTVPVYLKKLAEQKEANDSTIHDKNKE